MKINIKTGNLIIGLICSFFLPTKSIGQIVNSKYFKVGDTIPNFEFKIHNYKDKTARISDFKGKLVILDLWGVHCSTCIGHMPDMEALQNKFPDKIQILLVTKDSPKSVAKAKLHSDIIKNIKLPSVIGDDSLAFRFDYSVVPTHIWIDTSGVIKFITNGWDIPAEEKGVKNYLTGRQVSLKEKIDVTIDNDKPLLLTWFPYQKDIGICSYLAPFPNDDRISFHGGYLTTKNKNNAIDKVRLDRAPLASIYEVAYGFEFNHVAANRIILEGDWPEKNKIVNDNSDCNLNLFNYEIINPEAVTSTQTLNLIHQQLDTYLNAKSSVEKRLIPCYIIRQKDSSKHYLASGGTLKVDLIKKHYNGENVPWDTFINVIGQLYYTRLQLIDETGINRKTKVSIACNLNNWRNLTALNIELGRYGLVVSRELRMLKCIVINRKANFDKHPN